MSRYEQTISTFLTSLSVIFFVILILLLLNLMPTINSVIIFSIIAVSSVLVLRSFYSERRLEIFDISSPTFFESGLLVFPSSMNRCAVFFAFKITPENIKTPSLKRSLSILLKILPASTSLALEWTDQRECFITFYIKLNTASFLTQAREFLDHINKSFINALGAQCVQLLNGEALRTHFTMEIPGRFQKLSIGGKHLVNIQTDMMTTKTSVAILSPLRSDTFTTILGKLKATRSYRIIFPIKKTENAAEINKSLNLIFSGPTQNEVIQALQADSTSITQIPAAKLIRLYGEIISRNQIQEATIELDFSETASLIIDLLSISWSYLKEPNLSSKYEKNPVIEVIDVLTWRKMLVKQFLELELPYQKDVVVFIERLPLRFDAQVDELFFFVIPQVKDDHFQWLIQKISILLKKDETKRVILLLPKPEKSEHTQSMLSNLSQARQIRLITTKQELIALLKEKKTDLLKTQNQISQVAQKAL